MPLNTLKQMRGNNTRTIYEKIQIKLCEGIKHLKTLTNFQILTYMKMEYEYLNNHPQ